MVHDDEDYHDRPGCGRGKCGLCGDVTWDWSEYAAKFFPAKMHDGDGVVILCGTCANKELGREAEED